jgi:hypothetical protein
MTPAKSVSLSFSVRSPEVPAVPLEEITDDATAPVSGLRAAGKCAPRLFPDFRAGMPEGDCGATRR